MKGLKRIHSMYIKLATDCRVYRATITTNDSFDALKVDAVSTLYVTKMTRASHLFRNDFPKLLF